MDMDRAHRAYVARLGGATFREVGEMLGVGASYARSIADAGERRYRSLQAWLPADATPQTTPPVEIDNAALRRRIADLEKELGRLQRDIRRFERNFNKGE